MTYLLAEIDDRIMIAEKKFKEGKAISAEIDFLDIVIDIEKNDGIKHRTAVVDYWLGRIALSLGDIEYDDYDHSYPYKKFDSALDIFYSNISLFTRNAWIEDSIKIYRNFAMERVTNRQEGGPALIDGEDIREGKKSPISLENGNTIRFTYLYDNNYTYKISGNRPYCLFIVCFYYFCCLFI